VSFDPDMQEIVHAFLDESREVIADTEPVLMGLEATGADEDAIQAVFRMFHSMKGTAGFLGFTAVQEITHHAETLLGAVRDGELALGRGVIDALCQALDVLTARLAAVEAQGTDAGDEAGVARVVAALRAVGDSEVPSAAVAAQADRFSAEAPKWLHAAGLALVGVDGPAAAIVPLRAFLSEAEAAAVASMIAVSRALLALVERYQAYGIQPNSAAAGTMQYALDELNGALAELASGGTDVLADSQAWVDELGAVQDSLQDPRLGELLVRAGHATEDEVRDAMAEQEVPLLGEVLIQKAGLDPVVVDAALAVQTQIRRGEPADPLPAPVDRQRHDTLRVDVHKLDQLMDLVGELIIGTTAVIHDPQLAALELEAFQKSAAQLDRITRGLQDVAMSLRMTPVASTFRKMQRLVRDVAIKRNKSVRLVSTGEDTEVDKSVAEQIADPLVHLLRNAIDHGIEPEAERVAAGKSREGTIELSAGHQGGEVLITVRDDGRGLDRAKIHRRAVERGLCKAPLDELTDTDLFGFIFEPGFSTAEALSDISGRGVGMDVARKNIEAVNGRVDVHSEPGQGTTVILRIPLTLAIIEGMLVRVGTSCFTIPLLQIEESFVPSGREVTVLHTGQEMVRMRDRLLPVLRLRDFYAVEGDSSGALQDGVLVVVEDRGRRLCLLVDELIGQRQTVIKALSSFVGPLRGISGCTVLGDGRISLILDVGDLQQAWSRGAA
jgi:two-component system chemotaxis sensor kinase CheA